MGLDYLNFDIDLFHLPEIKHIYTKQLRVMPYVIDVIAIKFEFKRAYYFHSKCQYIQHICM